jgi:hypothetical protein
MAFSMASFVAELGVCFACKNGNPSNRDRPFDGTHWTCWTRWNFWI